MNTQTQHEATIEADPNIPVVRIFREFDAPPELVYRAHVDPELVRQWMGPRSIDMDIEKWDMRTGGEYRYTALRDGEEVAHFYGSIHRVWENEKIVQTFGLEEMPEAVALETLELVDLGNGRTRLEILSVVESMEAQAGMMASGMEVGINEGYAALDEVLASLVEEVGQRPSRDQVSPA